MRIFGFAGWSGSGKTTLIEQIIPRLVARGLTVSLIKHAHHRLRIRSAGQGFVPAPPCRMQRSAHHLEHPVGADARVARRSGTRSRTAISRLSPCDLALVEGYKAHPIPKLEIWRAEVGKPLLHPRDPHILAIATDSPEALPPDTASRLPVFALSDFRHCRNVRRRTRRRRAPRQLTSGGAARTLNSLPIALPKRSTGAWNERPGNDGNRLGRGIRKPNGSWNHENSTHCLRLSRFYLHFALAGPAQAEDRAGAVRPVSTAVCRCATGRWTRRADFRDGEFGVEPLWLPTADDTSARALVFGGYRWHNDVAVEASFNAVDKYALRARATRTAAPAAWD